MNMDFFLGANSGKGFYSLYDDFPGKSDAMLHIIKGGPGTGKSGFMKSLCQAAEERGMDVQRILCSGDPNSLDGIFIPALNQGWVDGTPPHAKDPVVFGVDSDYLNLGSFCSLPLSSADSQDAGALSREYRQLYAEAYGCLAAAEHMSICSPPPESPELEPIRQSICGILDENSLTTAKTLGSETRRFISAISCQGLIRLKASVYKLCKDIYCFEDSRLAFGALEIARQEALRRGINALVCPDPLRPKEALEAVLLPRRSIGFVSGALEFDGTIPIGRRSFGEARQNGEIRAAAMDLAFDKLSKAKAVHDRLEQVYRRYMDFDALSAFTDREIARLFEKA